MLLRSSSPILSGGANSRHCATLLHSTTLHSCTSRTSGSAMLLLCRLHPSLCGASVVVAVEIAAMVMEITAVAAMVMLDVALPRRSDARVVCKSRMRGYA